MRGTGEVEPTLDTAASPPTMVSGDIVTPKPATPPEGPPGPTGSNELSSVLHSTRPAPLGEPGEIDPERVLRGVTQAEIYDKSTDPRRKLAKSLRELGKARSELADVDVAITGAPEKVVAITDKSVDIMAQFTGKPGKAVKAGYKITKGFGTGLGEHMVGSDAKDIAKPIVQGFMDVANDVLEDKALDKFGPKWLQGPEKPPWNANMRVRDAFHPVKADIRRLAGRSGRPLRALPAMRDAAANLTVDWTTDLVQDPAADFVGTAVTDPAEGRRIAERGFNELKNRWERARQRAASRGVQRKTFE
jgi:hypothetical protein